MNLRTIFQIFSTLILAAHLAPARAQEVLIPDPGLNAAIRETLKKPLGPLTPQDLLTLTNLSASGRNISSVAGLEAARNLQSLALDSNSLTNFPIASALMNLTNLDLFDNLLTSFVLSNALPRLESLNLGANQLTSFT